MNIKEMIYGTRKCESFILAKGQYRGHKYYVLSMGTYPTAYVSVEIDLREMKWEDIEQLFDKCPIHGGISYAHRGLPYEELDESVKDISFIGWNYSHICDYVGSAPSSLKSKAKKWTTAEIVDECINVIDKMVEPWYNDKPDTTEINSDYIISHNNPNIRYGWVCPRCGKVNSPDACSCNCSSGGVTVAAGSTISVPDDIKISLSGTITGGSAPEIHFDKATYADGGTVITDCKINPEDFSTTTNTDSIVTFSLNKIKRNNK